MWKTADDGVRLSNLYRRPRGSHSVDIYMAENGNGGLGHRNYCLSILKKAGFGVSSGNEGFGATAMRFNMVQNKADRNFDWDIVSWPTPGYFPAETALFDQNVDQMRWSVVFNSDKYQVLKNTDNEFGKKTNVIVTRTRNGLEDRIWDFEIITANNSNKNHNIEQDEATGAISYGDPVIFYLNYGNADAKTGNISKVKQKFETGDVYTVRFENLKDVAKNKLTNLEYGVEFFTLDSVQ